MILDVHDQLVTEVDVARADLERAVRRLDAIDTLASLAAALDLEHVTDLACLEARLQPVDRARWQNAIHDAVASEAPEPDIGPDAGQPQHQENTTS